MEGGNVQWMYLAGADAALLPEQEFESTMGLKNCVASEMAHAAQRRLVWLGRFHGASKVLVCLGRFVNDALCLFVTVIVFS